MTDKFIQKHLDAVKVLKGLQGAETFYVSCFPGDPGAIHIPNTNKWIREISIHNIKVAFKMKDVLDKNKLTD